MTTVTQTATSAETVPPLLGYTVGVTAARRREEFTSLLRRRGAQVIEAPALEIVPLPDDTELFAATRDCLASRPDYLVVSTGIGFRGWMEAADGWGLRSALCQQMQKSQRYARGPKASGAMRAAGLDASWSPPSESSADLLAQLLKEDLHGKRVVVQQHGAPMPEFDAALRSAGATVVDVPVYRWAVPSDVQPLHRMADAVATRGLDAITFTSAPAVDTLLDVAKADGIQDSMIAALRADVLAACVGPICAEPLLRHGIECVVPDRFRIGALVRVLTEELPKRRDTVVRSGGVELRLRASAVIVDGTPVPLSRRSAAVLRALAAQPGRVLTRAQLLETAWPAGIHGDEHVVETTVGRLRSSLGPAGRVVQTVVKRGYRLAFDPHTPSGGS